MAEYYTVHQIVRSFFTVYGQKWARNELTGAQVHIAHLTPVENVPPRSSDDLLNPEHLEAIPQIIIQATLFPYLILSRRKPLLEKC